MQSFLHAKHKMYRARITGLDNIAKELALTKPYIRTKKKKQQIDQFIKFVTAPPKIRSRKNVVLRTREILGV